MKKARYSLAWCAVMTAAATAGCSSNTPAQSIPGNGGTFSVAAFEPPSFIPGQNNGAANEELDAIYAPLTEFNPQNKLTDVQAQSVTASDGDLVWTITIKPGWTFQNGEPVTAQSYINAWNATAYGPNAWVDNGDLADIGGYPALNPASGKPATTTLSGLRALNATTIQVRLIRPDSQFPLELSTSPFLPLPNAYFKNPTAWESAPIADGPYEAVGKWQPDKSLTVQVPGLPGAAAARGRDRVRHLQQPGRGVHRVAGRPARHRLHRAGPVQRGRAGHAQRRSRVQRPVDRLPRVPALQLLFQEQARPRGDLDGHRPTADQTKLFAGLDTPATSLLPPAEAGAPANACRYCRYDPAQARTLLAEGGGWKGPLVLWYPSGVGYDSEAQAIGNELTQNLGLRVTLNAQPFTALVANLAGKKVTNGVFFGHWGAYFPSMQNTLANMFLPTGADHIETWYSNPAVVGAIQQGNAASSLAAAEASYRQAEQMITNDVPVVPLFFDSYVLVHGPAVSNVIADVNLLELSDVVVK